VSANKPATPFALTGNALGSGCYSLVIKLERAKTLKVGKLGAAVFPKGIYVYTGSAMNSLAARLQRHCRNIKKLHWHIDYLLASREARIEMILIYPPSPGQECGQNQRIGAQPGAGVILKNFGSSDCNHGCSSHLFHFARLSARLRSGLAGSGICLRAGVQKNTEAITAKTKA
jgi:Uri superfamily endonuclease